MYCFYLFNVLCVSVYTQYTMYCVCVHVCMCICVISGAVMGRRNPVIEKTERVSVLKITEP